MFASEPNPDPDPIPGRLLRGEEPTGSTTDPREAQAGFDALSFDYRGRPPYTDPDLDAQIDALFGDWRGALTAFGLWIALVVSALGVAVVAGIVRW